MTQDTPRTSLSYEEVFLFGDDWFSYNSTTMPKDKALERAEKALVIAEIFDDQISAAIRGEKHLYFKITAGARAGTIMRLKNPDIFIRVNGGYYTKNETTAEKPVVEHVGGWANQGFYKVNGYMTFTTGSGYNNWSSRTAKFEIDGRLDISFQKDSSALLTMKPELLLDYQGPTLWCYGKPVKASPTMTDRFGQTVGVGDVVLLGQTGPGFLLTGKITKISDKKTVWIKHIGAKEEHQEKQCHPDQLLKLKDLEQVLMIEKLKAL